MLVVSPLHYVANIEEGDAVAISAGELSDLDLALLSSFFENKVGECVYFCDISDMPNLSYSKLSSEIASKSINFIRFIGFITCNED